MMDLTSRGIEVENIEDFDEKQLTENQPTAFDDESMDALRDIILKYVEDPDAAERLVQQVDDKGLDSLPSDIEAQLERDPEFKAWYHKLHHGSDADTDYMKRRREEDYHIITMLIKLKKTMKRNMKEDTMTMDFH